MNMVLTVVIVVVGLLIGIFIWVWGYALGFSYCKRLWDRSEELRTRIEEKTNAQG